MTEPAKAQSSGAAQARDILARAGGRLRDLLAPAGSPPLARRGRMRLPDVSILAGSFNPYAWSEYIDPKAGAVRLVLGLGTRFRGPDEDYSRLIALSAPKRRPEIDADEVARCSQHRVDFLDADTGRPDSAHFLDIADQLGGIPLDLVAPEAGPTHPVTDRPTRMLTFDGLISKTGFVEDTRNALKALREGIGCEVEAEFALTFTPGGSYLVHPLDVRPLAGAPFGPGEVPDADLILDVRGPVIGRGRALRIDRIVQVVPEAYGRMPIRERYDVAREIGRINRELSGHVLLIGPGRWGTASPELGVPVSFAEINRVAVLVELAEMHATLKPELSLATHFLNDLVARDMLYVASAPGSEGNRIGPALAAGAATDALRVIDAKDLAGGRPLMLYADPVRQRALCGAADSL